MQKFSAWTELAAIRRKLPHRKSSNGSRADQPDNRDGCARRAWCAQLAHIQALWTHCHRDEAEIRAAMRAIVARRGWFPSRAEHGAAALLFHAASCLPIEGCAVVSGATSRRRCWPKCLSRLRSVVPPFARKTRKDGHGTFRTAGSVYSRVQMDERSRHGMNGSQAWEASERIHSVRLLAL